VFLSGEIIHNPDVNQRIRAMGIQILEDSMDPEAPSGRCPPPTW